MKDWQLWTLSSSSLGTWNVGSNLMSKTSDTWNSNYSQGRPCMSWILIRWDAQSTIMWSWQLKMSTMFWATHHSIKTGLVWVIVIGNCWPWSDLDLKLWVFRDLFSIFPSCRTSFRPWHMSQMCWTVTLIYGRSYPLSLRRRPRKQRRSG